MCSFGSCQTHFEFLSQFRKVRNAFECFVTQVQTHLPKNQTRLAYEDKRDLYCISSIILSNYVVYECVLYCINEWLLCTLYNYAKNKYRIVSYEKLTKSEIRSSWSRFEHCSKSLFKPLEVLSGH